MTKTKNLIIFRVQEFFSSDTDAAAGAAATAAATAAASAAATVATTVKTVVKTKAAAEAAVDLSHLRAEYADLQAGWILFSKSGLGPGAVRTSLCFAAT